MWTRVLCEIPDGSHYWRCHGNTKLSTNNTEQPLPSVQWSAQKTQAKLHCSWPPGAHPIGSVFLRSSTSSFCQKNHQAPFKHKIQLITSPGHSSCWLPWLQTSLVHMTTTASPTTYIHTIRVVLPAASCCWQSSIFCLWVTVVWAQVRSILGTVWCHGKS